MQPSQAMRLLDRVALRERLGGVVHRFEVFVLVFAGLYAALLLVSRLSALIPDWFPPLTLLTVPLVVPLLAVLAHRRPSRLDAARAVDRRAETKDLFLTTTLIEGSPGEYRPLVVREAEAAAATIAPARVPVRWRPAAAYTLRR